MLKKTIFFLFLKKFLWILYMVVTSMFNLFFRLINSTPFFLQHLNSIINHDLCNIWPQVNWIGDIIRPLPRFHPIILQPFFFVWEWKKKKKLHWPSLSLDSVPSFYLFKKIKLALFALRFIRSILVFRTKIFLFFFNRLYFQVQVQPITL